MNTIIMTIKQKHLTNIRSGKKIYELRKTIPKCDLPLRVLLCESGSGGWIKAEFTCYQIDQIRNRLRLNLGHCEKQQYDREFLSGCCLKTADVDRYIGDSEHVFALYISDMIDYRYTAGQHIRHISEFGVNRPPQSWQYAKEANNEAG